jgi:hypothetical protein
MGELNSLFTFPKPRNYVEQNQNQPLADGTKVGEVHSRNNGNEAFMAMLAKAFERMFSGQGQETNAEKLKALRNDPIGDANKADYLKRTTVDNQGGMGPMTRASGMTPEQVARMQGRTAENQWKFPELFKAQDKAVVGNTIAEHNQGLKYIKDQQIGVVPTTDFRQHDPNMAGKYQGTNVRDFLISEAGRTGQAKADGFDPAPFNATRSIIPKASYGTTPGYATNGPAGQKPPQGTRPTVVQSPMAGFNPATAPAPKQDFGFKFPAPMFNFKAPPSGMLPDPTLVNQTPISPMAEFNPETAPDRSPMYNFNPATAPAPEFTYDKYGYKIDKNGVRYGRAGAPTIGPQPEHVAEMLSKIFPKY